MSHPKVDVFKLILEAWKKGSEIGMETGVKMIQTEWKAAVCYYCLSLYAKSQNKVMLKSLDDFVKDCIQGTYDVDVLYPYCLSNPKIAEAKEFANKYIEEFVEIDVTKIGQNNK